MEYLRLIHIFTPEVLIDISKILMGVGLMFMGMVLLAFLGIIFFYSKIKETDEQETDGPTPVD
jgi:hypothetical protein